MSTVSPDIDAWTVASAKGVYNIDRWGADYFDINEQGNVVARPLQQDGASVVLVDVALEAQKRGLRFPLLIRFQDILRHRVRVLSQAFKRAIEEFNYQNCYRGVFPIKVNQLREVVEEILVEGKELGFGLEVGSKPELLAALSLQDREDDLIICNGYKDTTFIRLALMGKKLGRKVILVVEKPEELTQIIEVSRSFGVEPSLGIRSRLLCKGAGKWADSAGESAKFGLSTTELVTATQLLKREGLEHCLELVHFHIGSQVPEILAIKKAVQEASRIYAKLYRMGLRIGYFDIGGGLAVDYDGSRTAFDSSMNYTIQEYANDVVFYLAEICNAEGVPHPVIISESGRALVAHHSVLIVESFGAIGKGRGDSPFEYTDQEHDIVRELLEIRANLGELNKLEAFHDARERKEDAHHMFTLGLLDLPDKAKIESLYWEISRAIIESSKDQTYVPEEIRELEESSCDQYLCNFSVFQSLLDHWALGQLFPIMPITRLTEPPCRDATLVDITCDSDGQVKRFIELQDVSRTLPLHPILQGPDGKPERYYLGFFLMGAYQDVMGDLHNLFGTVNEVHVFLDPDEPEGYYIEEIIEGTTIAQALAAVQYDETELKRRVKAQVDAAIRSDRMKPSEAMRLLNEYERGLREYTYLSF